MIASIWSSWPSIVSTRRPISCDCVRVRLRLAAVSDAAGDAASFLDLAVLGTRVFFAIGGFLARVLVGLSPAAAFFAVFFATAFLAVDFFAAGFFAPVVVTRWEARTPVPA